MADKHPDEGLSYRDAGVDIDAGNELVRRIGADVAATRRPGMLGGLGGFAGLFELPMNRYRNPVLVSGTDGVGTKLKLAIECGRHDGIGIDLVAMCVNDVVSVGAEPLFFLDYYATGHLDLDVAESVIRGIATGCRLAGAGLIGGETAEMPGMYAEKHYDLAGFCVGIIERENIVDGGSVRLGDRLIAIGSSGVHANGFSLVRRIIDYSGANLDAGFGDRTLGEALLEPTRIYVRPALRAMGEVDVRAIAHITGGGLPENLPRVLPPGLGARIDAASWQWPPLFTWMQEQGGIRTAEMYRTFNCGVGMVLVVSPAAEEQVIDVLHAGGEVAWTLGEVVAAPEDGRRISFVGTGHD